MAWYVVDGMDGAGKSTVAEMLRGRLESDGRRVLVITHPNSGTWFGRMSRRFLLKQGKAAMLFSTSFYVLDILSSLSRVKRVGAGYDDVIFVRYIMAVAYMPDGLHRTLYRIIGSVLPMPDVGIYVDVDAETAMRRINSRGDDIEAFETEEKLTAIRRRMLDLADGWIVVDNTADRVTVEDGLFIRVFGQSQSVP